ncbi:MAG: hypothetical protein KBE09_03555 [Candidatus Pacebacteria bacterium]|nr:hypothetical protein [Candidatus Paceibacterota bacterium]
MYTELRYGGAALIIAIIVLGWVHASAASLTIVSDTITTSAPSATSTHTIRFTVTNAVPPSGTIVLTPHTNAFEIPFDFGVEDIDFAYATTSGGPYTQRPLDVAASGTDDGVIVASGTLGAITLELNSSTGLAAGDRVQIILGMGASHGAAADSSIRNPLSVGSYGIHIATKQPGGVAIDNAKAMVAIVQPVSATVSPEALAPTRSNGLPSGALAAGNVTIEISLETDELAHCRYATSSNVLYANMTANFSQTLARVHSANISGHSDSTSYTYYVRCADAQGTENLDDYPISFSLNNTPSSDTSLVNTVVGSATGGGPGGRGGAGSIPNGSEKLFLASATLSGWAPPLSSVVVLKDGKVSSRVQTKFNGTFQAVVTDMERGTYTFMAYVEDKKQRTSSRFTSTLTLQSGTNNTLSNIILPPTVSLSSNEIEPGAEVVISGEAAPGRGIEVFLTKVGAAPGEFLKRTATSSLGVPGAADGEWSIPVDTTGLAKGTYRIRARILVDASLQESSSNFTSVSLGIGESPAADYSLLSDLNSDGKVNLIDFSILLSAWGQGDVPADINADGIVNLSDVSILLFNWTG